MSFPLLELDRHPFLIGAVAGGLGAVLAAAAMARLDLRVAGPLGLIVGAHRGRSRALAGGSGVPDADDRGPGGVARRTRRLLSGLLRVPWP